MVLFGEFRARRYSGDAADLARRHSDGFFEVRAATQGLYMGSFCQSGVQERKSIGIDAGT